MPFTVSTIPSIVDTRSSSRRIASCVSCTLSANVFNVEAICVAWSARSATPSARSACASATCEASGIFCVDTAVLDPLTWSETAENPEAKFFH
ncbi:hypothetical protein AFA91_29560 [Mycolicibacterium goodii]|uniref:Uncharacterized protein n=1 Tax=Mycolicibacterium goodii TaxID=134601 RepID=A0A0K0XD70_MYCGD|nr:hypothetical protein AFA91_29560 [Mycolicibacterium goodii]